MGAILGVVNTIVFLLNQGIYKFIAVVYSFILNIATQSNIIVTETPVGSMTNKIYAFVGVVMVFRLAIIILQYIADPDGVSDKKDGVGPHVIPHVVVVLVLLATTPTIFSWLYQIQDEIFESDFMSSFFSDVSSGNSIVTNSENANKERLEASGALFADSIMISFIEPCPEEGGVITFTEKTLRNLSPRELEALTDTSDIWIETEHTMNNECSPEKKKIVAGFSNNYPPSARADYEKLRRLVAVRKGQTFPYQYSGLVSLVVSIAVLAMLIATLFKVALRIFKLIALEIIAPIPIIMYIDPTVKKTGSTLERWGKAVISTYFDLFIRIMFINFVAIIIMNMGSYMNEMDSDLMGIMIKLFIIFGALLFMNTGPDFIMGLFGKTAEKGGFNPFQQMLNMPYIGQGVSGVTSGALLAAPGAIAGGVFGAAGGLRNYVNSNAYKNNPATNIGQMAKSIGAGTAAGASFGASAGFNTGMQFSTKPQSRQYPLTTLKTELSGAASRQTAESKPSSFQSVMNSVGASADSQARPSANQTRNSYTSQPASAPRQSPILDKNGTPYNRGLGASNNNFIDKSDEKVSVNNSQFTSSSGETSEIKVVDRRASSQTYTQKEMNSVINERNNTPHFDASGKPTNVNDNKKG